MRRKVRLTLATIAALALAGCVTPKDKSKELSRVAKDWCLTIRASQVIPVYPLTRDIKPGDVFLTTTPIGKEVELFEEAGFLPLDVHMVRLSTDEQVKAFYATRLGEGDAFPNPIATWDGLPSCAFPTYNFEVTRGGGINLAIPVQGVPVGLNYLGSASATGSVVLGKAQTVGLDITSLRPLLDRWERDNQGLLAAYATDPGDAGAQPVFLRVVTRVFRVSSVSVHLDDASRAGAQAAAGIDLAAPEPGSPSATKTAAEQYDDVASRLNTTLGEQFGGKVRLVKASRRSVTLEEDFDPPMVVGYLAFDCQVLPGGVLSAPMPTYQRLTGATNAAPGVFNTAGLLQAWYTADEDRRVPLIREWLEKRQLKGADGGTPSRVEFLSAPAWDIERRRLLRDMGVIAR
ncbi:MAG TPA: hypothetical protein VD971_08790 [Phycisphaerales bacterium]|nr:hypothetical protein [Phycisphaerales bacterium]